MQITNSFGIGSVSQLQPSARNNNQIDTSSSQTAALNPTDVIEFSSEAQSILEGTSTETENRTSRIASIRQEIASGAYDTDEKVSAALDRFLDIYG
jgi:negative regulator of flagellin synthesis FlgM